MREAILLKKLVVQPFIRLDKSTLMIQAYHQMLESNAEYAILSHHSMVDIGFVALKDVVKYLAHKYVPDQEIQAHGGAVIQIKHTDLENPLKR